MKALVGVICAMAAVVPSVVLIAEETTTDDQTVELAAHVSPAYVIEMPVNDGWTSPLMCLSDEHRYVIVSPGRDKVIDGDDSGEIEPRQISSFDEDIVYADGEFVISPVS